MNKRTKLNKIWNILSPDQQVDFTDFDKQVAVLKSKLKEKITVSTLADVQNQLERFKSKFNLQPLLDSLDKLNSSRAEYERVLGEIEKKTTELQYANEIQSQNLQLEIKTLTSELGNLEEKRQEDLKLIPNLNDIESRLGEMTTQLSSRVDALEEQEVVDWQDKLNSLRKELMARVNSIGGGSMNQRIQVNGTTMSTKYADINLKGTGITATDNNTTKQVDISFSGLLDADTLAQVSASSVTTPNSLYTMTSTIPVEFKTSGGTSLFKLNESTASLSMGGNTDFGPNSLLFGSALGTSDLRLIRSGANSLQFDRNGSGAITLALGTSDGTLRTGSVADNGNNLTIKTISTSRDIIFSPNNVEAMRIIQSSGNIDFSGNTVYHTDNTYDIGASGATRPRTGYFGTSIVNAVGTAALPSYTFTGDIDTGMWHSDPNTINFSTNGVERYRVGGAGSVEYGGYLALSTTLGNESMVLKSNGTSGNLLMLDSAQTSGVLHVVSTDGTDWVKSRAGADTAILKANQFIATTSLTWGAGSNVLSNTLFNAQAAGFTIQLPSGGAYTMSSRFQIDGSASGRTRLFNADASAGVMLNTETDATLWIKTTGNGDTATLKSNILALTGLSTLYNNVATTGYGHPAIYKSDRATGQTAAKVLSAFTVGASDGSFLISANVLITSSTLFNFTVTCTYTDEGNTSRVLTIPFTNLAGTALTSITNAAGTVPYEGIPQHIRCKAGTTIQIESAAGGTYTTVVYNIEECIQQIA